MRRLKSPDEIEKSEKKKKLIVGIILIALLVFSTAGFALNGLSEGNAGQENGEEPYYDGQYWIYPFGGQNYYFTYSIGETEMGDLNFTKSLSSYSGKNLYIDAENSAVLTELANNLGRFAGRIQEACYGECERDLPEKTCEENMIIWRDSGMNKVTQNENCIFIEGDLRIVDAFLYKVLGFN
ncbi:MAG: hypothetical protein Q8P57_04955 [Candidatus Pacearchaeota archaeon]|nr:hypothetical protein [Candidatus Pacearchaeota archaeon]